MNDHESLQGFWKLISTFHAGKEYEAEDEGTLSQFFGNRFRHIRNRMSSRFELIPETSPKGMDFVQVSTKFVVRSIYELQGDTLRIGKPQSPFHPRPTSFDHALVVEVYHRFRRRVRIKRRVKAQIPSGMGSFTRRLLDDIQMGEIPEK